MCPSPDGLQVEKKTKKIFFTSFEIPVSSVIEAAGPDGMTKILIGQNIFGGVRWVDPHGGKVDILMGKTREG